MDFTTEKRQKETTPPLFMMPAEDYRKLIAPESIALLGVTRRTGKDSNNPLEVLQEFGFKGKIYPVNIAGGKILEYPAYKSLMDVPEVPDLAMICSPRDTVSEFFSQCAQKGVRIVIIVAQGFTDGDEDGAVIQQNFLKLASKRGIRIIGPNTLGIVNNFNSFCTSFIRFINPPAPVGILSQSGIYVVGSAGLMGGTGLCIDTGNTADVEYSELIGHMVRDPRLSIINIYMEGVRNGVKFMEAVCDAVIHMPVIVFKTGSSTAGAKAAGSHTGSMTGEDRVYDTAFRQCGLIRAENTDDVMDLNKTFQTFSGIRGNRIGVVTISGGAGIHLVDAFAQYGLEVAKLSRTTKKIVADLSPRWFRNHNPIDIWPAAMKYGFSTVYRQTLEALMVDPTVDAVVSITGSFLECEKDFLDITSIVQGTVSQHREKPLVCWTYGGRWQEYIYKLEKEKNVVVFPSLDRAARSLGSLYLYHHRLRQQAFRSLSILRNGNASFFIPANQQKVEGLLSHHPPGFMKQDDTLAFLELCGFTTARWEKADSIDAAVAAAERIGFPVTLKISSTDIVHKSDVAGIRLNLPDSNTVRKACTEMTTNVGKNLPSAHLTGFLVQEFVSGGTELILGCKRDDQFGPVIIFGSGGVFTEIYQDIALRILPIDKEQIKDMMGETRVMKILKGFRNVHTADLTSIVETIYSFVALMIANPSIQEADINPLLALPDRVIALDARILLK